MTGFEPAASCSRSKRATKLVFHATIGIVIDWRIDPLCINTSYGKLSKPDVDLFLLHF